MLSGLYISVCNCDEIVMGGSISCARSVVEAAGWGKSRKRSKIHVGSCLLLLSEEEEVERGGSCGFVA